MSSYRRAAREVQYFPIQVAVIVWLSFALGVLLLLIEINAVQYAYERIGMSPHFALACLVLCLLGSRVNIPIHVFRREPIVTKRLVECNGIRWIVPVLADAGESVLAVNVGGAIVPTLLALRLTSVLGVWPETVVATMLVASIVYATARPVPGLGITVPTFVAPVVSAVVAVLLARDAAPAVAFAAGTFGTLIGADLMNIGKIRGLGAPVASIGGAGTFDGIFITGVLAVLLA
jgi:uncharacterized membrane protein